MGENSTIEWTDHTWNPWIGCQKLSPACDNCYAERDAPARVLRARGIETWGPHGQRVRTSEENWKLPGRWNRRAEVAAAGWADGVMLYGSEEAALAAGHLKPRRPRVFCLSQGDWLDNAVPVERLADMLDVVRLAPALDWLLLTKRIGAWNCRIPAVLALAATSEGRARWPELAEWLGDWIDGRSPLHVWIGTTICDQREADRDVPKLVDVPAAVRFLSVEPMLGPVNIRKWLDPFTCADCGFHGSEDDAGPDGCSACGEEDAFSGGRDVCKSCGAEDQSARRSCPSCGSHRSYEQDMGFIWSSEQRLIEWVICGGESGPHARPMHPQWARDLRDQCAACAVPFLFKQWGEWAADQGSPTAQVAPKPWNAKVWPDETIQWRTGKQAAGRVLDGVLHDGYPGGA